MLTAEVYRQAAAQKRRDTAREKPSADGYALRGKTAPAPSVAAAGARKEHAWPIKNAGGR